jgi:uncharacterized protein DUF6438
MIQRAGAAVPLLIVAATVAIALLLPSGFPRISDWNSLKITLERSPCFGRCPDYKVEIHGDGTVIYDGRNFVAVQGRRESRIPIYKVRGLFEQFSLAGYFSLKDGYHSSATDLPTYVTSISFDDKTKSVRDYLGTAVGMPRAVVDLEDAIDRTADTQQWIRGPAASAVP